MISTIKSLWRQSPKLVLAFGFALTLSLYFLGDIVWKGVYWSSHRDMQVQPWMTVGYIGKSWNLDPREIDQRAGLPLPEDHPLTLLEIAADRGVPVAEIITLVETTITQLRAQEEGQ